MKPIPMPSFLREVFGETQRPLDLFLVLISAFSFNLLLLFSHPFLRPSWYSWKIVLSHLLIFDIAAGAIANLTHSTNEHYQARPSLRYAFYAVHIHLIILFLLLDQSIPKACLITALTVAASLLVNAFKGHPSQRILAASLVVLGSSAIALFLALPSFVLLPSVLFVVKLTFSFSVHHAAITTHNSP